MWRADYLEKRVKEIKENLESQLKNNAKNTPSAHVPDNREPFSAICPVRKANFNCVPKNQKQALKKRLEEFLSAGNFFTPIPVLEIQEAVKLFVLIHSNFA